MTYKTHVVGGLVLASAVGFAIHVPANKLAPMTAVGGIFSLLPDLDMPNSKASRYGINRLVAYPLNKLFGHRGFIHSPLLCIVITVLLYLCHCPVWLWAGFGLGFLSHLVLDSLNPSGIPWLWPYKKRFHLLNIKTNTMPEYLVLTVLLVAFAVILTTAVKGAFL